MVDLDKALASFKKFLDSAEGQKVISDISKKWMSDMVVKDRWADKVNVVMDFDGLVDKVIRKYESKVYRDRWYNRGIEPPEYLFWVLFECAAKYGRECSGGEWVDYGNMFTNELFHYKGYYFNKMIGQGSCIKIIKAR